MRVRRCGAFYEQGKVRKLPFPGCLSPIPTHVLAFARRSERLKTIPILHPLCWPCLLPASGAFGPMNPVWCYGLQSVAIYFLYDLRAATTLGAALVVVAVRDPIVARNSALRILPRTVAQNTNQGFPFNPFAVRPPH
ncbi:hypothetical protein EXIGLDRAFT_478550 [Exidia glandulosa HHB12029]|uniref:Uncharacterized protein n=1 Tax=Exidia glandulosa HHB12029 TaxID=1314781 RepID=A0A166AUL8_EXIGL|nr:hypothetical protein EXIGLDRAFT_478550 [Exidia glandulosa HHB12029]